MYQSNVQMHPGEFLREEFMAPLGLSARKVADMIDVPANRISELVAERRAMTADTAFRLERLFSMPAYIWMGFQQDYDSAQTLAKNDYSKIKPFGDLGIAQSRLMPSDRESDPFNTRQSPVKSRR